MFCFYIYIYNVFDTLLFHKIAVVTQLNSVVFVAAAVTVGLRRRHFAGIDGHENHRSYTPL